MGQGVEAPPCIKTAEYELETVHEFVDLGSIISDSPCLERELNRRLGKAATTLSRLNKQLTEHTKD